MALPATVKLGDHLSVVFVKLIEILGKTFKDTNQAALTPFLKQFIEPAFKLTQHPQKHKVLRAVPILHALVTNSPHAYLQGIKSKHKKIIATNCMVIAQGKRVDIVQSEQ